MVWERQNFDVRNGCGDALDGDHRQIEMEVDGLVMLEGDLVALARRAVFRGCFPFAMAISRAATMCLTEHKVLFARDAAAPDQGGEEEQ